MTAVTADRSAGRLRVARRLSWGVVDQAVSSLQNFLLGAYIAKTLGLESLGAFALTFLAYGIVLNASRALSTDPLAVRFTGPPDQRWRTAVAASGAVAVLVGVVGGVLCVVIGVVLGQVSPGTPTASAFVVMGVVLPMLTAQDSWRYAFFASAQGGKAVVNDAVWAATMILVLVVGEAVADPGLPWALAAFGGSAALAALLGTVQSGIRLQPTAALGWIRSHRDLGVRFLAENVTLGASGQIRSVVVAVTAGLVAAGAVRGAEMLVGPVLALLMGVSQVSVPEAVRSVERGRANLERKCLAISGGLAGVALLWGLVVVVVFPHGLGVAVVGSVWPVAAGLIPGVTVSAAAGCMFIGPSAGLRGLGRADLTLVCQVCSTAMLVAFGAIGAVQWGALGAVWGTAVASSLGAMIWWSQFRRAARAHFASDRATT